VRLNGWSALTELFLSRAWEEVSWANPARTVTDVALHKDS